MDMHVLVHFMYGIIKSLINKFLGSSHRQYFCRFRPLKYSVSNTVCKDITSIWGNLTRINRKLNKT
jgi:hypothetical protein